MIEHVESTLSVSVSESKSAADIPNRDFENWAVQMAWVENQCIRAAQDQEGKEYQESSEWKIRGPPRALGKAENKNLAACDQPPAGSS